MLRTFFALLILLASSIPVFAQDCKPYFFNLIHRAEGSPAPDWKQVLEDLHYVKGLPKNPSPGVPPAGIGPLAVMIDAGGNARGRMWSFSDFPTIDGNGNAWYTHEWQVIADGPAPGTYVWVWQDVGGGPSRQCGSLATVPPVVTPPQSPPPDYTTQFFAELNATLDALRRRIEQLETNPPRVLLEDALLQALRRVQFDCQIGRTGPGFLAHGHPCTVKVQ